MPSLLRSCQSVKSNSKATKVSIARLNTLLFQVPSQASIDCLNFCIPVVPISLWLIHLLLLLNRGLVAFLATHWTHNLRQRTPSQEPQSGQRTETSAQEHLVSGLRDQIPGFHQITFHLRRIHQTRSFWTLINNLTKHYHLNANQTILRILLLIAT